MNSKLTGSRRASRANTAFGSRKTFRVWNSFEAFKKFLKLSLVTLKAPKKGLSFSPWDYWPWLLMWNKSEGLELSLNQIIGLNAWSLKPIIQKKARIFLPCLSEQALWLSDSHHYYIYEAARASAKREAEDFAKGGGEAAKVYHPHKQFVKSWFVVEHGSLICSVSHNPLFFLTPLLSCPLLGFLRDHKQKTACAMHLC